MRKFIDAVTLCEKFIFPIEGHRKPVVVVNPTKTEFWSVNFRESEGANPSAAGVILKDGTVVVGDGSCLAHDVICAYAGLDIENEKYRLQIWDGVVMAELWVSEEGDVDSTATIEEKIAAVESQFGLTVDEIKAELVAATSRFVPGWKPVCGIWTDYTHLDKV
jgi:hypothetical protein